MWIRRATLTLVAAMAISAVTAFATHAEHYADRARMNGRSVLAEIAAQPLCSGAPLLLAQSDKGDTP